MIARWKLTERFQRARVLDSARLDRTRKLRACISQQCRRIAVIFASAGCNRLEADMNATSERRNKASRITHVRLVLREHRKYGELETTKQGRSLKTERAGRPNLRSCCPQSVDEELQRKTDTSDVVAGRRSTAAKAS